MTITDLIYSPLDLTEDSIDELAPGDFEPVYLVPDNPWLPWANRSAGFAMGAWTAAITTLLLDGPLLRWSVATSIAATLLFAWVVAGHELFEKHPTRFKKAL
jgi:hypothetical protein